MSEVLRYICDTFFHNSKACDCLEKEMSKFYKLSTTKNSNKMHNFGETIFRKVS
jgi:hypothetical protein